MHQKVSRSSESAQKYKGKQTLKGDGIQSIVVTDLPSPNGDADKTSLTKSQKARARKKSNNSRGPYNPQSFINSMSTNNNDMAMQHHNSDGDESAY